MHYVKNPCVQPVDNLLITCGKVHNAFGIVDKLLTIDMRSPKGDLKQVHVSGACVTLCTPIALGLSVRARPLEEYPLPLRSKEGGYSPYQPRRSKMESIIAPLVAAFAANTQYDDDVVTYDDLLEQQEAAIHYATYEDFVFDRRAK